MDKVLFNRYEVDTHSVMTCDPVGHTLPQIAVESSFVAVRKRKDGKRLAFPIIVKNKALELFYRVSPKYRKSRIPEWFSTFAGIPRYLFRLPGKSLSVKQVTVSVICRLYYLYRFVLRPVQNTATSIRAGKLDRIYQVLYGINSSRTWRYRASIALRRLKVLLCPFMDHI